MDNVFNNNVNTGPGESAAPASRYYDKMKKALCIFLGVISVLSLIFGFFLNNSKFLQAFTGFENGDNILPFIVYYVINAFAMVCLGIFSFISCGTSGREIRLEEAKKKAAAGRSGGGYVDVRKEASSYKTVNRLEAKERGLKVFSVLLAVLGIASFLVLFGLSGLPRTIIELSKKEIDRVIGTYRVLADFISQLLFTVSVIFAFIYIPKTLRNSMPAARWFLGVSFVLSAVPAVHYAYFFFGNITAHASPMDFTAMMIPASVCGFIALAWATDARIRSVSAMTAK